MTQNTGKAVLVILDGVGIADPADDNAFIQADTPTLDRLFTEHSFTELDASGPAVGLPEGYMGNSEVGHLHIGAGRVIPQDLMRINEAIADGSMYEKEVLQDAVETVTEHDSRVHLIGLASDGGVHGHIDHLLALLRFFAEQGVDVETHAILDGRDVPPQSAEQYLQQIEEVAEEVGTGHIGSIMGRYYAMDRDTNWDRTEKAYQALTTADDESAENVFEALNTTYDEDETEYFASPKHIRKHYAQVERNDVVVLTNYRKDRARQLTAAFTNESFAEFTTEHPETVTFISMKQYKDEFDNPVLFSDHIVTPTFGEIISDCGLTQLRLSESQKKPHVTYFFDGQREKQFPHTDVHIIPSAKVRVYDEKPEMEAESITSYTIDAVQKEEYDFILVNYPNGDLVGHTGNFEATVTAVETVDNCIKRLKDTVQEHGYTLVITSDHGNCEKMRNVGGVDTSHTLNKVPFCIVSAEDYELDLGGLAQVSPTMLELLNLEPPEVFSDSLIANE